MNVLTLCKFTPLGFETFSSSPFGPHKSECKFTPLGFETLVVFKKLFLLICVNLPRWGLKRAKPMAIVPKAECKFTPLGFETSYGSRACGAVLV